MPDFVQTPWFAVTAYLSIVNAISFVLFWWDKTRARRGGQRVPEKHLLMLAAFGGTIGAKAGQRRFRHKTYKRPFKTYLNVIGALQLGLIGLLLWMMAQTAFLPTGAQ